jgi:hypothetical protein
MHKQFLNAQREIKHALKDAVNPHFKSTYATLESVIDAVKDIANKHDILITQIHGKNEFGHYLETILMFGDGENKGDAPITLCSKIYLEVEKPTMQSFGSAISYARRYALASIFCLASVDDDGNNSEPTAHATPAKAPNRTFAENEFNGSYMVVVGKKHNGKTLDQIGPEEVYSYKNYLIESSQRDGKKLSGDWLQFVVEAEKFLNFLRARNNESNNT